MPRHDFTLRSQHDDRPMTADIRWTEDGPDKRPTIVFVHGFKGFKDWGTFNAVADWFAAQGFVFLKFNLSHNGTTPEKPTEHADLEAFGRNTFSIELDDIGTVIDHLHQEERPFPVADPDRLYLVGHSRGGGISLIKAAEDQRVRKLATWAAVSDLNPFDEKQLAYWKETGVLHVENSRTGQKLPLYYGIYEDAIAQPERLSVEKAALALRQPVLLVHGTKDPTVPHGAMQQIAGWANHAATFTIDGADHVFGGTHPFEAEELPEHLQTVLRRTAQFFAE